MSEKEMFYGVPSKRKFPLDTEKHVRSAVKFFNYVDEEDEETLAKNLLNRLAYFNITDIKVSEKNRFFNYIPSSPFTDDNIDESVNLSEAEITNEKRRVEDVEDYIRKSKDKDKETYSNNDDDDSNIGYGMQNSDFIEDIMSKNIADWETKRMEELLASKNLCEDFQLFFQGQIEKLVQKVEKEAENSHYSSDFFPSVHSSISHLKGALETLSEAGFSESDIENFLNKNFMPNVDSANENELRAFITAKIAFNKTMKSYLVEFLRLNYKSMGFSTKEAFALIEDIESDDTERQQKAREAINNKITNLYDKCVDKEAGTIDLRKVGGPLILGTTNFEGAETQLNKDNFASQWLQKISRYDCMVICHGNDETNTELIEKNQRRKNMEKSRKDSEFRNYSELSSLVNPDDIEKFFNRIYDLHNGGSDNEYIGKFLTVLRKMFDENYDDDEREEFLDRIVNSTQGEGGDKVYKYSSSEKEKFKNECKEILETYIRLSKLIIEKIWEKFGKNKLEEIMNFEMNITSMTTDIDYNNKTYDLIRLANLYEFNQKYTKYIKEKSEKFEDYDDNEEDEKINKSASSVKEVQLWTIQPIKYHGKEYQEVNALVRRLIKDGFKNIYIQSCNPGHHELAKDIQKAKDVKIFHGTVSMWAEDIEIETLLEDSTDEIMISLNEARDNLISFCKENGIDYFNDEILIESFEYVNSLDENILLEGKFLDSIKDIGKKLVEFIVYLWKKVIEFFRWIWNKIKDFFLKIKEKISGDKSTKTKKPVKVGFINVSPDGSKVSVQEKSVNDINEINVEISKACKSISNAIKYNTDTQTRSVNYLKQKLEEQQKKREMENKSESGIILKNYAYKDAITDNANCLVMSSVDNFDPLIQESNDKSTLDKSYKPKERYNLNSYKKISLSDSSFLSYLKDDKRWDKEKVNNLLKYNTKGYLFIDKNKPVAYIMVCDGFICPLYVYPEYRNHGLSDQILDYAVKKMDAKSLHVYKDNEIAIHLYNKHGFKKIDEGETTITMSLNENADLLQEYTLSQTFMALKIHPRLEMWEILKKHEYPGFYNLIDKTKKIEDLEYMRKDLYLAKRQFTKLKENLEKYRKNPEKKNRLLDNLIKKGVTSKDIDLTIEYYDKKVAPHINGRINELRKLSESIETTLTKPFLPKSVTLYHGSSLKLSTIKPTARNIGTKLSSLRLSSFWCLDKEEPLMFAIHQVITDNFNDSICTLTPLYEGNGIIIAREYKDEVERILKKSNYYLYEKTIDKKYIGRGHNVAAKEYTLDIEVKPDKIYVYSYKDIAGYIKYVPFEEIMKLFKEFKKGKLGDFASYNNIMERLIFYSTEEWRLKSKELKSLSEDGSVISISLDNKIDPILTVKEQEKNELKRLLEIQERDKTFLYPSGLAHFTGYRIVNKNRSSNDHSYIAMRELDEGYFELKYNSGSLNVKYHSEDDRPEMFRNESKEKAYRINPEPLYEFGGNINQNRVKKDIMMDEVIEITLDELPENLFITSDIHIGREDEDIVPMNEAIEIINRDVHENDTLLILGDIGYKKDECIYKRTKEFLDSLKCKNIWLVFGNHDLLSNDEYAELGVKKMAHRINYKGIIFTHYPVDNNLINICGHYHKDYLNSHFDLKKSGQHINVFLGHTKRVYSFEEYLRNANVNLPKDNYYEYQYSEASVLDVDGKLRRKQLQAATKSYKNLINKYDFKILKRGFVRKLGMEMDYDRYIMGDIHECKLYLFEYERYNTMRDPAYSSSKTFLQVQAKLHQFVDEMAKELRCKVEMDMNPSNLQTYLVIHAPEAAFMESSIAGLAANVSGSSQNNKPDLSYLDELSADQSINDLDYDMPSEGFLFDECAYLNREISLDNYAKENLNVFSEGQVFFGEDDREYNIDLWLEKDKDILWITGFTDESAIADYTKQYNCFMRNLDDLKIEMMEKQDIKFKEKDYYNFYYNLFNFIKERYKGQRMIIYGSGVVFFDSSLLKSEPVVIRERSLIGYIMDCIKFDSDYHIVHNIISYNQTKDFLKLFKKNMDKYNVFDSSKEALKYIKSGYLLYTEEEIRALADTKEKYIVRNNLSCKQVFLSYRKMIEFVEKNTEYKYFSLISLSLIDKKLKKNPLVKETLSIYLDSSINELCSRNKTQIKKIKEVISYLSEASFNIDAEGSLIIKTREKTDFMSKYNLSHKLIKIYKKAKNLDGLKHELCKLWFMYIVIEKYYINPKRTPNNEKFKELQNEAIKAKSFILNEIYQTLEFILTFEPGFDFSKYYEESPYYKDTIKITTDNVKGFKKMIQALIS